MSRRADWLSPGDPAQRTGGYIYNAKLAEALSTAGWDVRVHSLPGNWPLPHTAHLRLCAETCQGIEPGSVLLADGFAWPGLGALRKSLSKSHTVIVIVHSLLEKEFPARSKELTALESASIREAHGLVCTSNTMERLLASKQLSAAQTTRVVCPGVEPSVRARGSNGRSLLCVSNVIPRKGIRDLLSAVAMIRVPDWTLDIAGSLNRDEEYAALVTRDIERLGLNGRVRLHGELAVQELDALYDKADVLVHAAHFEAFGMTLTEAVARCIPIVSTPAGALDYLPDQAYTAVPVGDITSLAETIQSLMLNHDSRETMQSAASRFRLMSWTRAAEQFEAAVNDIEVARRQR